MKILKSLSFTFVLLFLMGATTINNNAQVTINNDKVVVVQGLGNNVIGLEITVELVSGSFNTTPFTSLSEEYCFGSVVNNQLTIYITSSEDISNDGEVILGKINCTSNSTFKTKGDLLVVDHSLNEVKQSVMVSHNNDIVTTPSTPSTPNTTTPNTSLEDVIYVHELSLDNAFISLDTMEDLIEKNKVGIVQISIEDILVQFEKDTMVLIEGIDEYNFTYVINSTNYSEISSMVSTNLIKTVNFLNHNHFPLVSGSSATMFVQLDDLYNETMVYIYGYDAIGNTLGFNSVHQVNDNVLSFTIDSLNNFVLSKDAYRKEEIYVQPPVEEEVVLVSNEINWLVIIVGVVIVIPLLTVVCFLLYKAHKNQTNFSSEYNIFIVKVRRIMQDFYKSIKQSFEKQTEKIKQLFKK